ncbi:PGF-CTERM sorting domain-containing protein [Halorhabdus sp. CBA1104]|uniref:PGF-CTERM sorting domain-containing protein n=1 Tax=Halorhabdus sp. CBA1104 TaxID=1380432 RepID=UPI0012B30E29|nr:PGF-CTERM sorting domain-containing protein [Halorhabdus sp. CBA1104]QGN06499.1 PGF-CTERM sorting domain-containing protein [Halorhabdus sp. CBA1104]
MSVLGSRVAVGLWVVVLVGAMAVAPFGGIGLAQGQDKVTLTLAVGDSDGNDVGDVTLNVSWADGNETVTTRANGQALVDVPRGSNVTIAVEPGDYVRNVPVEITDASAETVSIDVARKGSIDLQVDRSGTAVPNATVRLTQDGQTVLTGETNGNGQLQTGPIERGSYEIAVTKPGHLNYSKRYRVTGDVSRAIPLEEASVSVTFDVRDGHFDTPRAVTEATVDVDGIGSVTTLSNGEATLRVPVNTEQTVTVRKDGYTTNTTTVTISESAIEHNVTVSRTPELALRPANDRIVVGETVRVVVTDEYGQTVSGATVSVEGESVGTTDSNGALTVPIEAAGELAVVATADGLRAEATVEGVDPGGGETATATETETETETATPTEATTTVTGTDTPGSTTVTTTSGPGFGIGIAIATVLSVALLARRQ